MTGDPLLADLAASTEGVDRLPVARGLSAYARGLELYHAHCYSQAREPFHQARRELRSVASPFEAWVAFFDAICALQSNTVEGSRVLEVQLENPRLNRYPILEGRIRWVLGNAFGRQDRLDEALDEYAVARRLLGSAFGDAGTAFLDLLAGESLGLRGQREAAWRARHRAFAGLARAGDARRWHSTLRSTARSLTRDGLPRAARKLLDEAVANAEHWGDSYALATSHLARGRVRAMVGDAGALADFARAEEEAAPLSCDVRFHAGALADLRLARAASQIDGAAGDGVLNDLGEAIDSYTERRNYVRLARALALRGMARRARDDAPGAASDLWAAAELYAAQLAEPRRAREPLFVADAQAAFRHLVALEIERGDIRAALRASEQSRIMSPFAVPTPAAVDAWLEQPLADTAVLVFQDLDERLLLWLLDADGVRTFEIDLPPDEVRTRVQMVVDLAAGGDPGAPAALGKLHDLLLAEALAGVDASRLVVVADRSVVAVPFAALRDAAGVYLVEKYSQIVAPGLAAVAAAPWQPPALDSALVLGDPATGNGNLDPLQEAAKEARRVAAYFDPVHTTVLLGEEATRERFLELWTSRAVVHVAAHSTLDIWTPYWWRLHLAPGSSGRGDLEPDDLKSSGPPDATRLMVLSSCSSALDGSSLARAPFGIGGAFLAAGVPAVIGALWSVDDASTVLLMDKLHQGLAAGAAPDAALARAQRTLLGSEDPGLRHPRSWAAFRLLAGTGGGNL